MPRTSRSTRRVQRRADVAPLPPSSSNASLPPSSSTASLPSSSSSASLQPTQLVSSLTLDQLLTAVRNQVQQEMTSGPAAAVPRPLTTGTYVRACVGARRACVCECVCVCV